MKNLKLFLLPLLLLLSGGFTATQQTVLFSGGCPTIGGACPSINLNFTTGKYWVNGVGFVPLTSVVSTTRASSKICANAAGVLTSVGNNILCVTDQGALIEEARTNKSTNYNANPPALVTPAGKVAFNAAATNVTAIDTDGLALFGIVDDTVATTAAGFQNIANGRVYKIDNTAGTGTARISVVGVTGNTNAQTFSAYIRGGTGFIGSSGSIKPSFGASASYVRRIDANRTPSSSVDTLQVLADVGQTVYFILNQLEEGAFVTSPIVIAGASATRAADIPQLIGPALTAALNAKAMFAQTSGVAGGTSPRLFAYDTASTSMYFTNSITATIASGGVSQNAAMGSGSFTGVVKSSFGFDSVLMTVKSNNGSTGTTANPWSAGTTPYLGNRSAGDRALNGYMQDFALQNNKGVFDASTTP